MKSIYFVMGIIMLVGTSFLFLKRANRKDSSDILTVGMMSGWMPFMSVNLQGEYEGFDVDVAQEIAHRMGKKLVIKDLGSLAALFVALDQNKVDMILSGLDMTEKRMKELTMAPYTGQEVTEFYLVFWKQILDGIKTMHDLKNYKNPVVCVEPGVSSEKLLDQFAFVIKKPLATVSDMVLDIEYGKSVAAFLEPHVVKQLIKKQIPIKAIPVPLPPELQIFGMGIGFKKGNPIAQKVADIVQELRRDGTLPRFEKKWDLEVSS